MRLEQKEPNHEEYRTDKERPSGDSSVAQAASAPRMEQDESPIGEPETVTEEDSAKQKKFGHRRKRRKKREKRTPAFASFQDFLYETLSFRLLCEVFIKKLGDLLAVGVVFSLIFMLVLTFKGSFTASTIMSLNYEESTRGKTPNGARFSESEFLTQEYLEAILQATGLQDDLTTADLADCISVTPTTSRLVTKEDDYYISSSYSLTFQMPLSLWGKITANDFLKEICRVYNNRFTADYRTNATSLDLSFDYTDMDYEEIGSYFQMMINRINNYLIVRNNQAGSYLSSTGQSYSDLKKQVQNLQSYTLAEYQSYIWENGVAKDNSRNIDDLNAMNRTLHWDQLSDSQKSSIYMSILNGYNDKMTSSVLIPTYDSAGAFYMARTKTGIDDLALEADSLLDSAVGIRKSMATNESKIAPLREATTKQELEEAQSMVDNITRQLKDIVSAIRALDTDCYAQRISSYLVFSSPEVSMLDRYNVKSSVMLAAVVCIIWYLAAVVRAGGRKQRERQKEENE